MTASRHIAIVGAGMAAVLPAFVDDFQCHHRIEARALGHQRLDGLLAIIDRKARGLCMGAGDRDIGWRRVEPGHLRGRERAGSSDRNHVVLVRVDTRHRSCRANKPL